MYFVMCNKIASDIKLVFHSSTITIMHGPINIRFKTQVGEGAIWHGKGMNFPFKCSAFLNDASDFRQ